jgi:hypothetical protein
MNKSLLIVAGLLSVGMLTTGEVLASGDDDFTDNHQEGNTIPLAGDGDLPPEGGEGVQTIEYAGVGKYTGQVKNGIREGYGTMEYENDEGVYEGDWKNDGRHGKGKIIYKNKDMYEGDWKNDRRRGNGRMITYSDENEYEGNWKNDKKHGYGTMKNGSTSGNGVYTGNWYNDKRDGKGRYEIVYGEQVPYEEFDEETGKTVTKNGFERRKKIIQEGPWRHDEFLGTNREEKIR